MRKMLSIVLLWTLTLCVGPAFAQAATLGVVYKQAHNPFYEAAMLGFEEARAELGFELLSGGPEDGSPEGQAALIEEYLGQGADAIAVSANDAAGLSGVLGAAMDRGVPVVSWDAEVQAEDRSLHMDPHNTARISSALVREIAKQIGGAGRIAILRQNLTTAGTDIWVECMKDELAKDAYRDVELVAIAFGEDDYDKSYAGMQGLISAWPDLKGVIAPSVHGIEGAAACIRDSGLSGQVKLTGLGTPSGMADALRDGACEGMYLWNPVDWGYCTAYAAMALVNGDIEGKAGETFDAGRMGRQEILGADDGGLCVVLDPFCFTAGNIDEWEDVY